MSVNPRLPLLRVPSKKQKKRPITHPRFSFPYFPLPNHHRESSLSLGIVAGGGVIHLLSSQAVLCGIFFYLYFFFSWAIPLRNSMYCVRVYVCVFCIYLATYLTLYVSK